METFDLIVIGAGSAGCVAAAELADRNPDRRVLLLESGPPAEANPETLSADGYPAAFINDRVVRERYSVPQPGSLGRRLFVGSGTGAGGSGAVNGMIYVRGARADYESWPAGWRWPELLPDFEAIEGKLRIRRRAPTRFTEACLAAASESGFRRKEDLNDGELDGVAGYEWMSFEGERRMSSYAAFLLGRERPNLELRTGAVAHRVRFTPERAVSGVELEQQGARTFVAASEVLLCAGALESPRLLLLSGVGPGPELRRHGIPAAHELRAVGENLQDHPNVTLFFLGRQPVDCEHLQLYGFHRVNYQSGLPFGQPDTCYVFYPARSSLKQAMQRMLPGLLLSPPLARGRTGKRAVRGAVEVAFRLEAVRRLVERLYGIVLILGKPLSRGSVRLGSASPSSEALIDPGTLSDPRDLQTMLEGVRLAQRIAAAPSLEAWGNRRLDPAVLPTTNGPLARWIRRRVMTTYHFAGTCRMGADPGSVVDERLRVRGVRGLRVADASVIPELPVSPINAPSMLIGYRAAALQTAEWRAKE